MHESKDVKCGIAIHDSELRRGMAGMIISILVLGFMMAVSYSYTIMVQGEIKAASVEESEYSGKSGRLFRKNPATFRSEATSSIRL